MAALPPTIETHQLARSPGVDFRVLSWNISRSAFADHPEDFRNLLRLTDPDIVLLDEVGDKYGPADLIQAFRGVRGDDDIVWNVSIGAGGGYQRGLIGIRGSIEQLEEFRWIDYPESALDELVAVTPGVDRAQLAESLAEGAAVNGGLVRVGSKELLVVIVDLWCCGTAERWEERRRVIEARLIRQAIRAALARGINPDGIILAGDFNLVGGSHAMGILAGPYRDPFGALIPAEAYHIDGSLSWTWDGRGSEFPSSPLDFAMYSPFSLEVVRALIVDTEDFPDSLLSPFGLSRNVSKEMSDHRPILVDYRWRAVKP